MQNKIEEKIITTATLSYVAVLPTLLQNFT